MSRTLRTTAAVAVATVTLLAAACGGNQSVGASGSSTNGVGTATAKALAFAQCMRSHGVPNFPDPGSSGDFNKDAMHQLAVSNSQYQPATQSCGHLLPNSGDGPTAAEVQQEWSGMLNFARCMRSHGVPSWPDPTPYPPRPNEPTFTVPASIQPTPQIIAKMHECLRLVPNNNVVGHIDNDNWEAAQQAMAGL